MHKRDRGSFCGEKQQKTQQPVVFQPILCEFFANNEEFHCNWRHPVVLETKKKAALMKIPSESSITKLVFDIANAKMIKTLCFTKLFQHSFKVAYLYLIMADLACEQSWAKMWECCCLKFIMVHHRATSPLNAALLWSHILQHMRPVLRSGLKSELVSSILKPVIAMGWERWFVGSVYYSPRSGREGSVCVCVCTWVCERDRTRALSLSVYS